MSAVPLVRTCQKCGHLNEHRVRCVQTFGGTHDALLFTCSVCDYVYSTPCADVAQVEESAEPELDAEKVEVFKRWFRSNPAEFSAWLRREVRIHGGRFWA